MRDIIISFYCDNNKRQYYYDLNGNYSNYRTGKNNQLLHDGENAYEYDSECNRISKGLTKYYWEPDFSERDKSEYDWNRTFTGQVYDNETGLMLYRNRYYDVIHGRFLTMDPIKYQSNDVNLYQYVNCSPMNHTDTTGLSWRIKRTSGGAKTITESTLSIDTYDSISLVLAFVHTHASASYWTLLELILHHHLSQLVLAVIGLQVIFHPPIVIYKME
jgi:RHS repeat-associated protein